MDISLETSEVLISALKSGVDVNVEQHETSVRATRDQARAAREAREKLHCERLSENGGRVEANRIIRSKEAGAWVTAVPSTQNGTMLAREE